ncbi:acyltransferase family protein [Pseudovibrio sp. Alg231-02]|uniref:acyltransferase family protein n=1 Tax=Pseudovibrio sp. Alg231-02 TaxID=1922223 RepID=UPI000D54E254|nr:acyltransferase family protein [Pseudovibrio sp. Alg231-02]
MPNQVNRGTVFRPDIEGLRGLAVLLVVLFHFKLFGLQGGFIGVDIFFVISGFLMTKIITSDQFEWSWNGVGKYYKKRFWRIAPAYYVTLIAIAVLFLAYPYELHIYDFRTSFLTASFFAYNIHAPSGAGYFEVSAYEKPLLHLWSLGVEVQFYILWPLILLIVRNKTFLTKLLSILFIVLLSFIASVVLSIHDPDVAYFSIPTRLWQFGAGGIAAVLLTRKAPELSHSVAALLTCACLLTLFGSAVFAPQNYWPSFPALLPVAATAILLWLGNMKTKFSQWSFSAPPVRFIGKISYSLYLVHWPVVVWLHLQAKGEPHFLESLIGLFACIALGCLLYWFIEKPFRTLGRKKPRLSQILGLASFGILFLSSAEVIRNDQLLQNFIPTNALEVTLHQKQNSAFEKDYCRNRGTRYSYICAVGAEGVAPSLLVWGDSHARALGIGLSAELKNHNKRALVLQTVGCPPYLSRPKKSDSDCRNYTAEAVAGYLEKNPTITTVLMASRWMYSLRPESLTRKYHETPILEDGPSNLPKQLMHLEQSIQFLGRQGQKIILATQAPEITADHKLKTCRNAFIYQPPSVFRKHCWINSEDRIEEQYQRDQLLRLVSQKYDYVELADLKSIFCNEEQCEIAGKDGFYLHDHDHLTTAGSAKVVREVLLPLMTVSTSLQVF